MTLAVKDWRGNVKKVRHVAIRMMCVVAFLVAGVVGSPGLTAAAAQSSGIYVSQMTGAEVDATGSWTYLDELTDAGSDYEFVGLQSDFSIAAVAFFPGSANLELARDAFLDGFASEQDLIPIDRGAYGQVSYSLDLASVDGIEMGVFTVFQGSLLEGYAVLSVYMAPISFFASGMSSAQDSITLDGTPLFEGVDPAGLQDLLEPNAGASGGQTDVSPPVENESETGRGGQGTDLSDYEELGLVSESEYVSPQHDVEVVWDDNWYFDDSADDPISSDASSGFDSISITWTGEAYVVTYIDILESEGFAPEDYVEYWLSDEFASTVLDADAEILLEESSDSSGAVLYRDYLEDGTEISMLREATCLDRRCDLMATTMMIGLPETFGDAYADAEDGIEVDGDALFTTFSSRQIDRASD